MRVVIIDIDADGLDRDLLELSFGELSEGRSDQAIFLALRNHAHLGIETWSFFFNLDARIEGILLWNRGTKNIAKRRIIYSIFLLTRNIKPIAAKLRAEDISNGLTDEPDAPEVRTIIDIVTRLVMAPQKFDQSIVKELSNLFSEAGLVRFGAPIASFARTLMNWEQAWEISHCWPIKRTVRGLCESNEIPDMVVVLESLERNYISNYVESQYIQDWPEVLSDAGQIARKYRDTNRVDTGRRLEIERRGLLLLGAIFFRLGIDQIRCGATESGIMSIVKSLELILKIGLQAQTGEQMLGDSANRSRPARSPVGCGSLVAMVRESLEPVENLVTRNARRAWAPKVFGLLSGRNNLYLVHGFNAADPSAAHEFIAEAKARIKEFMYPDDWDIYWSMVCKLKRGPAVPLIHKMFAAVLDDNLTVVSAE